MCIFRDVAHACAASLRPSAARAWFVGVVSSAVQMWTSGFLLLFLKHILPHPEWALARERERMPSEGMFHQPAPVRLRRITMKLLRLFQQWCAQEVEFRHRVAESSKGESLPKKSPFPLPAQEIMTDTLSSFLERTLSGNYCHI